MKKHRNAIAVFILALLVMIPTLAKVENQGEQITTATAVTKDLQSHLAATRHDLSSTREQAASELKRRDDELAGARREIDQLKKEVDAARAPRPAVRLAQPSQQPTNSTTVEAKARVTAGVPGNCESYRPLVAQFFPPGQVGNALITMGRESGCNPRAVSPAGDYGLMQIHFAAHAGKVGGNAQLLLDPATNIRVASMIYRSGGWCQWVAVWGILC